MQSQPIVTGTQFTMSSLPLAPCSHLSLHVDACPQLTEAVHLLLGQGGSIDLVRQLTAAVPRALMAQRNLPCRPAGEAAAAMRIATRAATWAAT